MIKIINERTKYHRFAFIFDYDKDIVEFCRSLRDAFGWQQFSFDETNGEKKWVFSDVIIAKLLLERFQEAVVSPDILNLIHAQTQKSGGCLIKEKIDEIKEKKDTDFVVKNIKGELYPYQKVGVEFLVASNGRAIISDPPGLGKSAQALGYITHSNFNRSLIVAPASVKSSWENEIKKWTKLSYVIIDSKTKLSEIPANIKVWVINYDIVKKHIDSLLKTRFDFIVSDECVVAETMVATKEGQKQITEIKKGDMVLTLNEKNGEIEYKKVVRLIKNRRRGRPLVRIGDLLCTEDHKIYDGKSFVRADMAVKTFSLIRPRLKVGSSSQVLAGTLMGDASLQKNKQPVNRPRPLFPRLRVGHTHRNSDYVKLKAEAIDFLDPQKIEVVINDGYKKGLFDRISSGVYKELDIYYNLLYKINSNEKKENLVSIKILNDMGIPGLAIWIQDDGTISCGVLKLCSYRYGYNGNKKLQKWWKKTYGITPKIFKDKKKDGRTFYGLKFNVEQTQKIYSMIRDYIVPSMYYKFDLCEKRFTKIHKRFCVCGKKIIPSLRKPNQRFCSKNCCLKSRNKMDNIDYYLPENVYDLEIKDNHNYFADGILIHNCHYLKNQTAQRTKAIRALSCNIPHIVLLSGTPLLSRPIEMFTLLNMIDPNTWNNWYSFSRRYCDGKRTRWGYEANGATNTEELHERIKKYFIRRKKEDVLQFLPPKNRIDAPVELTSEYAQQYERAENDLAVYLKQYKGKQPAEIARAIQAEKLTRLNVLRYLNAMGKIEAAKEYIDSIIEAEEKVLVFSSFVEPLQILKEKYGDISVMITGNTDVKERGKIIETFQKDQSVKVFLGGVKSAGVGVTLTAASNVIFLDYSWNPADMNQAEDRCHRPSQEANSVNIYQLYTSNTIDEKMKNILKKKQNIFDRVVEGVIPEEEENKTMTDVVDDILIRQKQKWAPMDLTRSKK